LLRGERVQGGGAMGRSQIIRRLWLLLKRREETFLIWGSCSFYFSSPLPPVYELIYTLRNTHENFGNFLRRLTIALAPVYQLIYTLRNTHENFGNFLGRLTIALASTFLCSRYINQERYSTIKNKRGIREGASTYTVLPLIPLPLPLLICPLKGQ
jgi:hypothetical protein